MTQYKEISQEDIAHYTGQDNISGFGRVDTPILQLSGKTGKYSIIKNKEEFELDGVISGVIVKIRKYMQYYPEGGAYRLSTGEGDTQSIVPLWINQPNQKTQVVMRGNFAELKMKYPQLKMCPVLYIVLSEKGDLVKFTVKGKSSMNLFNYYKEFDKDEHIYQFITEFSSIKDEYQGKEFWTATFLKGKKVQDEMAIILKAKELTERLENVEMQFSSKKTENEEEINVEELFEK